MIVHTAFKKDASHGLSYEKMMYRIDKLHPRVTDTDDCTPIIILIFHTSWLEVTSKVQALQDAGGLSLSLQVTQTHGLGRIWTRNCPLFLVLEIPCSHLLPDDTSEFACLYLLLVWKLIHGCRYN